MAQTNIFKKLFKLKRKNPVKDTEAYKYKYSQLDQVVDVVNDVCAECGLQWRQGVHRYDKDDYTLITFVLDNEGNEAVLDERPYKTLTACQEQGSFDTYTRRYALLCAFGLAPEDDDGAAASVPPKEPSKRDKMVLRIMELTDKCIEQGVKEQALNDYMQATFNTVLFKSMSEKQLIEYGKHLSGLVESSKDLPHE